MSNSIFYMIREMIDKLILKVRLNIEEKKLIQKVKWKAVSPFYECFLQMTGLWS